jgi:cytochrome P450
MAPSKEDEYDLYSQAFKKDAYATYALMRERDPIYLVESAQGRVWFITRYEDVRAVLRDHARFRREAAPAPEQVTEVQGDAEVSILCGRHMLNANPPEHTRLARLTKNVLSTQMISSLAHRIEEIARGLIDAMLPRGEADLVADFAFPLPVAVISELLGLPYDDREQFRRWSSTVITVCRTSAEYENFVREMLAFKRYLERAVQVCKEQPSAGLISALVHAQEGGDRLTDDEIYSTVFLVLTAGHETTVNFITNGMRTLFAHPAALAYLRDHPEALPRAVEELLRIDGPVERALTRYVAHDLEFRGFQLRAGDAVIPVLASGSHDPAVFEDSAALRLDRDPNPHLAFGYGTHYCIGAQLARLEGQIAIGMLLARLPGLRLAVPLDALRWRDNAPTVRALLEMPVAWSAPAAP